MITIHQLCYNEILLLEFAYNFYKSRFPSAKFVLHDNGSTDGSADLAEKLGYEIKPFDTGNQMDDASLVELKNNCWKQDDTDWVIVADMDELIDINEQMLTRQQELDYSIIQTFGFQMVNLTDELKVQNIHSGFRENDVYDKCLIFNKKFVQDMHWAVGCHTCNPSGSIVRFSSDRFHLLHFKYLSEDFIVNRYKDLNQRRSQKNIENKWSVHYEISEQELREYYKSIKNKQLTKLIGGF